MHTIRFRIDISPDEYLAYYRGTARNVVTTALDGRSVCFPARILRPFVTKGGIQGEFLLLYDAANRFAGIERVG